MTDRPIRDSIRLPPEAIRIDFGPMPLAKCREIESYVARVKGRRGRRDLKAELAHWRKTRAEGLI